MQCTKHISTFSWLPEPKFLEEAEFFPSPVLASASAPAPTPNRAGTSGNFNLLTDFFKVIKLTGLEARKYGKD